MSIFDLPIASSRLVSVPCLSSNVYVVGASNSLIMHIVQPQNHKAAKPDLHLALEVLPAATFAMEDSDCFVV